MTTWTSTPRTWATGETLTAALLNAQLKDPLIALGGAWNSYTPQVDQGASTNIAKTVTYAKYLQFGKLIIAQLSLAMTGTGTAGSSITVTLPVTAASNGLTVGSGHYFDTGNGTFQAVVYLDSTTKLTLNNTDASPATVSNIGVLPNIAVANGDIIRASFTYEAA